MPLRRRPDRSPLDRHVHLVNLFRRDAMDRGRGVGPFLFNPGGHSTVYVDGREVASTAPFESRTLSLIPTSSGLTTASGSVQLTSGRHEIRVAARLKSLFARDPSLTTPYQLRLAWLTPEMRGATTFPRHDGDAPTSIPVRYPGVNGRQEYSEGVLVGYRWYDAKGIVPLFPFGHGLSYTTFAYSELTVRPRGDGFDVSFRVRNSGAVAGAEVAQVYVRCTWALRRETSAFAGNSITVASESPGTATCARVDHHVFAQVGAQRMG